jgi:hypothetical protein
MKMLRPREPRRKFRGRELQSPKSDGPKDPGQENMEIRKDNQ